MYVQMSGLALGGAVLRTALPLSVGRKVVLRWKLPGDREVEADAKVIWNSEQGPPAMGLEFLDIRHGQESLRDYLERNIC